MKIAKRGLPRKAASLAELLRDGRTRDPEGGTPGLQVTELPLGNSSAGR